MVESEFEKYSVLIKWMSNRGKVQLMLMLITNFACFVLISFIAIGGIVSNTLRPPVPESCDPDWRRLMERCWSAEPSERPSFIEIANDLRSMAAKIPPKGQVHLALSSTNPQVKS